jgi:hypothetical protein
MAAEQCRVVLTGELIDGYSREAVIAAMARLLRVSAGKLIDVFDGQPQAFDEVLTAEEAAALQRQLEALGAKARVDMEPVQADVLVGLRRSTDDFSANPGMMQCPACGHRQLVAPRCEECGAAFTDASAAPSPSRTSGVTPGRGPLPPGRRPPPRQASPLQDIHARDAKNWADAWVDEGNEMPSEDFHLSLFMGLNGERLLRACQRMRLGPRTLPALSWNGSAVISPFLWTMYRKMWLWSAVVFVAEIFLPVLFIALGTQPLISDKFTYLGIAGIVANRLFWPFVVDYLYCRHSRRMVLYLNRISPTYASDIDIATAGGTSKTAVLVGVVLLSAAALLTWNVVETLYTSAMQARSDYTDPVLRPPLGSADDDDGTVQQTTLGDDAKWIMTRSAMRSMGRRTAGWLQSRSGDVDPARLTMGEIGRALALDVTSLLDRWGNEIRYRYEGDSFTLVSAGADLQFDTDDDIRVSNKLQP